MHVLRRIISVVGVVGLLLPMHLFASTGVMSAYYYQSWLCTATDCDAHHTLVYWNSVYGVPVTVTDTHLSGTIWSETLGWIKLDASSPDPTVGVRNTTSGVLSNYAWGSSAGFVNFSPSSGGVTINTTTGEFSGYAWVSGAGWMLFDCARGVTACVKTDWRPSSGTTTGTTTGTSGGSGGTTSGTGGTTGTTTGTTTTTGGETSTTGDSTTTGTSDTGEGTTGGDSTGTSTTGTTGGDSGTSGGASSGTGSGGTSGGGSGSGTGGIVPIETTTGTGTSGCVPSTGTGTLNTILSQVKGSYCETEQTVTKTYKNIQKIFSAPSVSATATTVTTVGVVASASFTIVSGLFLNPLSFSEIFLIPARLWSLVMAAFGLKKRRRPWGTVYDGITKQPLDPVYVTLRDSEGAEVMSSITDLDGRFGFVVPSPGSYTIFAHKTNYQFPSQKLVGRDHDELYRDLYFGEYFRVENAGDIVIKNIPMDPEHFDWNEFAKKQQNLMKFYSKRDKILRRLSDIFFGVGFAVAATAVLFAPKTYNIVIVSMYCVLFFVRRHSSHSRPYGDIVDAKTGDPLSFALIRISNGATGFEVMHRIADAKGRYYALLPNGEYKVRIDRKLLDGTYTTVVDSAPVSVKKGYLSEKFKI